MLIDIHCHILPGLDDGSPDMEHSIAMARVASGEGIQAIIATPHHANGEYLNDADVVRAAVEELNDELGRQGIPVEIYAGQEIRVYDGMLEDYERGAIAALHQSPYILLEFPPSLVPRHIFDTVYELGILGLTPVIAHPERNREIADNLGILADLIEAGALSQVTSHSLNGFFGSRIQEMTMRMCRCNLVHLIASDAHHPVHRPFDLGKAYRLVADRLGTEYATYYQTNAEALFRGQPVEVRVPIRERVGIMGKLFKKK